MAINYPTGLDSLTNPSPTSNEALISHSNQHSNANDILEALETKVGINYSPDTGSLDYRMRLIDSTELDGTAKFLSGYLYFKWTGVWHRYNPIMDYGVKTFEISETGEYR